MMNLIASIFAGGLFTGVPIFILTRKKYKVEVKASEVEVKGSELDQVEKAATIWRTLSEELLQRFKDDLRDLRQEYKFVQEENGRLKEQLSVLEKRFEDEMKQLQQENKVIKEENHNLKTQMSSLQRQLRESEAQSKKLFEELKKFNKNYVPA